MVWGTAIPKLPRGPLRLLMALILVGWSTGIAWADAQYSYDAAGRLTGVIDVNGSTQYNYDNAGNILSVVRTPAPVITSLSTNTGLPGSSLTITGSNFDPVNSKVWINNQLATITSATTTTITVVIPAASSGKVTVQTPGGVATSTTDFIIPPAGYTTSAVASEQRIALPQPGQSQSATASVNAAHQVALVLFDAIQLPRINAFIASTSISGGSFSLYAPSGAQIATTGLFTNSYLDDQTLVQAGTYSLAIVNSASAGNATLTLINVPADVTNTLTVGGSASILISTRGQHGSFTFTGTAGQRLSPLFDFSKMTSCNYVSILNPDGTPLIASSLTCASYTYFSSPYTLGQSGTYTVTVTPSMVSGTGAPVTWGTGTTALTLFNVPADPTTTASIGGSAASLQITAPGQHGSFTFTGTAGQRISPLFDFSKMTTCNYVSILNPDGTPLIASSLTCANYTYFSSPYTLGQSGTYTVAVTPSIVSGNGAATAWGTGTMALTLIAVPADVTTSASIGGGAASLQITAPGQHGSFTFTGTAGQRLSTLFDFSKMTSCNSVSILNPDGTPLLASTFACQGYTYFSSPYTLGQSGTYTVTVTPSIASGTSAPAAWGTGTMALTLFNVPADATNSLTIGGGSASISITTPGQHGSFTFSAATVQHVSLQLNFSQMTTCNSYAVLKPDGTYLVTTTSTCSSNTTLALSLPAVGTYTVTVTPSITAGNGAATAWGTGTATATVSTAP